MRPRLGRIACLLPAIFLLAFWSRAAADTVQGSTANGFARLLFSLDPPGQVHADISGGVITLVFDRKVDFAPANLTQGLDGYVASARSDADGKTFRLAAAQRLRLHTSASGSRVAIDFVPETFAGTPPDLPPAPPKAVTAVDPATLPPLVVRAGAYSDHARLVFDWPKQVPFAVFRGVGRITIRFEAAARPDFTAMEQVSPPWVKEAGWRIEGRGTVIDFDTDPASGYHSFRDGTKIALDILAPRSDSDSRGTAPARQAKSASTSPASTQVKEIRQAAATLNGTLSPPASAAPAANAAAATSATPAAAPRPAAQTAPAPAPPVAPEGAKAYAKRTREGAIIVFPGAGEQAVVAFIRGRTAVVAIDGKVPIDAGQLKAALGDFPMSVDASADGTQSLLRIGLRRSEEISADADGADLKVVLAPRVSSSAMSLELMRTRDGAGRSALSTTLPGATHTATFADPDVGDSLILIAGNVGHAVPAARTFAEFAILPSAAGLVLKPYDDDLVLQLRDAHLLITRAGGLALNAPALTAASPSALLGGPHGPSFLDLDLWAREAQGNPLAAQRHLREAVAGARGDEVNPARLRLARFYLATGYAAEALGEIALIQKSDPAQMSDPTLLTMRAAADVMLGRYRDARNDLSVTALDDDRNAAVWRGLAEAGLMNWDAARKALATAEPVLGAYSKPWQAEARIAMVEASLAAGALADAESSLAHIPSDLPGPLAREAELARGEVDSAEGRSNRAEGIFRALEASGDEHVAAEAIFADVGNGLAHGLMSDDVAIRQLEALRFRWRGDGLELRTLRKLGELYFARSRWRDGLGALRVAVQNFPHEELGREAQDDMRKAFENLFLKGRAESLSPIAALGIFYDFVDLTPIGPEGDEMIRKMADRLVAMDLLEPAATLLNYQITKRLDGVARAQVATRLAMIDLLDRRPKDALEALRTSEQSGLPDAVGHARKLLQARALAALKQWDKALDVIALDDAPDSRQLRADIYWESGNWEAAGQKAEELLSPRAADALPLSADEREEVMRAAISYSLANDEASLDRLRARFAPKMKPGPDASAFDVVTQPIETQGTAFRDRAGQIASIDTFEAFMRDFRKRFDAIPATN